MLEHYSPQVGAIRTKYVILAIRHLVESIKLSGLAAKKPKADLRLTDLDFEVFEDDFMFLEDVFKTIFNVSNCFRCK